MVQAVAGKGESVVQAAYIYEDQLSRHVLRTDHPMRPVRLRMTHDLLAAYGLLEHTAGVWLPPRPATVEELLSVHSEEYIEAVRTISDDRGRSGAGTYGFSISGDNPIYEGMWEAALLSTGASLVAMEQVLEGKAKVGFSPSGGLHHAMRNCASGFCIFNDPAVIIAIMAGRGLKVAYLDIDAHHGDGVQDAFYDTDQVMTISTHEAGKWLFPGTGDTSEIGTGRGRGYSVNIPMAPYTNDHLYAWAYSAVIDPLLEQFRPDVVVAQLGVDGHEGDPLAHLHLTTRTYDQVMRSVAALGVPWIALGGGGYKLDAVARVWTLEYARMLGVDLPNEIPAAWREKYGVGELRDRALPEPPEGYGDFVRGFIEESVRDIRRQIFPIHHLT